MCGRFAQQRPSSELAEIFDADDLADDPGQRYNVAPTDEATVVVQREDRRAVTRYRWGLIPHWAPDRKVAARQINARGERISSSPSFRDAFRKRRCIVPVDSFYEWRRAGGVRQPYRIASVDGRPLALAGLWAGWRDPDTEQVVRTFTIVTTTPNDLVSEIHDRMPVVLADDAWRRWLDPDLPDVAELHGLIAPVRDGLLMTHPVSTRVNNVRNDGPDLLEPIELAPLES